ncbi:MAG: hypothetical protein FOGNACKC_04334 [Anaerolineae bacterium]|nr:hypothetical protein [Anaerolineae bacterium]
MFKKISRLQALIWGSLLLFALSLSTALAFPVPNIPWLTYPNGTGSQAEASDYYSAIGAPGTFAEWKNAYGFDGNEVRAVYYNASDLGFGRDMHCRRYTKNTENGVACYVVNHGLGPGGPKGIALHDAIAGLNPLPTVAMVYNGKEGLANDVRFYVYDSGSTEPLINTVPLDHEQTERFVPHICLPCHGGTYNASTNSVAGAQFLPFDAESFKYSQMRGYTRSDQQEDFRKLNELVLRTNPTSTIQQLINNWYDYDVGQPGKTPKDDYVPPGFEDKPTLYNDVVKPYCRMCHVAQNNPLPTPTSIRRDAVFGSFYMPHTELTSRNFWAGHNPHKPDAAYGPAMLAYEMGWSLQVNTNDDNNDGKCDATHCSLREAIQESNQNSDQNIITFASNLGVIQLRAGANDNGNLSGDLDIYGDLIILGNGAGKTVVDGGANDRIFEIFGGSDVIIRGLTIRGGSVADNGGGIQMNGSTAGGSRRLTIVDSLIENNAAGSSGGGIYAASGTVNILNSALINNGASSKGGGIATSGPVYLNIANTTIAENYGNRGGGISTGYDSLELARTSLTNVTVTSNYAGNYGGIYADRSVSVYGSIIAGNFASNGSYPDVYDASYLNDYFRSSGYNIIGNASGVYLRGTLANPTDQLGDADNPIDPLLGSFTGTPGYYRLQAQSPAVDQIPPDDCITYYDGRPAFTYGRLSYDSSYQFRPQDGNNDGDRKCDIGAYELPEPAPSLPANLINPLVGGAISDNGQGLSLKFPGEAADTAIVISIIPKNPPAHSTAGFAFAIHGFEIIATRYPGGTPVTSFDKPYTLTLSYSDSDWQSAGIEAEDLLNLHMWTGSDWETTLPCSGCFHDPTTNKITLLLDRPAEFALLGPMPSGEENSNKSYLPLIVKN